MREETTTRKLYTFKELSEEAQAKVIEQARQSAGENFDYAECVYEDAATIADLFGLDIRQRRKTSKDGSKTWYDPTIFYSGFWSQGDGACFEGQYSYRKGAVKAVKEYAPQDTTLHQVALDLQHAQAANFYRVTASIKHRGHYYHSGCMYTDLENSENRYQDIKNEDAFIQAFKDFADCIYNQLEKAYDWETSEENARDYLENNDDEYTEDGSRA